MKKSFKFLVVLAGGIVLHLLVGWPGVSHAVGVQGQTVMRVCIWSGAGLCWVSILRGGI